MAQHIQGPLSSSEAPSTPLFSCHCSCLQHTALTAACACDTERCEACDTERCEACDTERCEGPCCCGAPDSDFSWSLPAEMSEQIFLRLDPWSLCSAAQTCRRWHRLIHSSEAVWRGQCLLLRAHCGREVERDRHHGYSWKVILLRNFARCRLKRDWLRGRFSCVRSANELRDVHMVPFDAESWGEILQSELDR